MSNIKHWCRSIFKNMPKKLRWAGHAARMEEGRSTFKTLTGKPTRKRSLGRYCC